MPEARETLQRGITRLPWAAASGSSLYRFLPEEPPVLSGGTQFLLFSTAD